MVRGFSLGHCGRGFKTLKGPALKDCLSFTIPWIVTSIIIIIIIIIIVVVVNFSGGDGDSSSSSVKVLTLRGFID